MKRSRLLAATVCLVAPLALFGCGDDDDSEDSSQVAVAAAPTVHDAWARASAEGQANGAAYMVITGGEVDDRLIAAEVSTDIAARAEIHETVMAEGSDDMAEGTDDTDDGMGNDMGNGADNGQNGMGGTMTMREVDAIDIPAGEDVALEPGGYHVMFLDLVEPLAAGDEFDVTLTFEQAGEITVTLPVRTP